MAKKNNKKRTKKRTGTTNETPKPRLKPVCKFLLKGQCTKGDECTFLHSPEAAAEGARAAALREGKSEEDAEIAAGVAFEEMKRKMELAAVKENNSPEVEAKETAQSDIEYPPTGFTSQESDLPPGLSSSLSILSPTQQSLATKLCTGPKNQRHLFQNWSTSTSFDSQKKALLSKLQSIDESYPDNGLFGYLSNAQTLLAASQRGENPLEGWIPSVPKGERFEIGTKEFWETEELGLGEVGRCGFVLVAGGLGERLGYGDIKIGLPTELATETSYIQFYIETILAFQSRYAAPSHKLPLCIMTSGDTNDKTVAILKNNNYFGMDPDQITIVQQGQGVPALLDNDAHIAVDPEDPYNIQMKPHGHGDIHALLHSHGVAKQWLATGTKWTVFFQDTNGLAFHTLPLSLGVSSRLGLIMNSITCPRKAGQAIGGIAKLSKGDQQKTINVEYNQLDPLLRASGSGEGDVNDSTGFSPYPGNINQLLFRLDAYVKVLERTKGVMPEFVNPKYKDAEKTVFKKPTRLECMMQDFPTVLQGSEAEKVGFTSLASEMCFSPVKNTTSDGVALQSNGTHPGVAATGEADQSSATRQLLRSIGCQVSEGSNVKFNGIEVVSGPDCVLKPSFAACSTEYKKKFPNPSAVKISGRSSLVLKGEGLVIESLELDGALIVECEDGASGVIRNLIVKNKGWMKVSDEKSANEIIKMRGYHINKFETRTIVFKKDGSIEGDYSPEAPVKSVEKKPTQPATEEKPKAVVQETALAPLSTSNGASAKKSATNTSMPSVPTHQIETAKQPVVNSQKETVVNLDLSKPASSERKEKNTLCGDGCIVM